MAKIPYFCHMSSHEKYMHRCLELAQNGLGTTYPNPLVGSVVVCDGSIIGEGWHQKAGGPHAEVNAIRSVKDQSLLKRATIYVSLEPCSHFGKTPPCSDLIIANGIPNVVIGTVDPNEKVAGKGLEKLRNAGITVTAGVLEKECNELNKRFFTFHNQKRPYVILKWAQSQDGFIAPETKEKKEPVWLSNVYSRQLVHKWRTEEQAILVGTQTVLEDNPKLDARDWKGNNPVRIILDKSGKIGPGYHVFDGKTPTIFITEKEKTNAIDQPIFENVIFDSLLPQKIMAVLYQHQLQSVIIEGGRQTLQTFIDTGLWDEARVFISGAVLKKGVKAPEIESENVKKETVAHDELLTYFNYDYFHNI